MVIFLLLLLPIVLFLLHRLLFQQENLPPGPSLLQLWQNRSLFATNQPHVALKELAAIYGPLLSLRVGSQLVVVASSPSMAESILKTNNLSFSGRFIPAFYYDVPGATNASLAMARDCGASWKFLRGISRNFVFSPKAMESAASIRKAKVMEMVKLLRRERGAVNIEHSFCAVLSNIVTNVLASRDLFECGGVGARDERMMKFLHDIVEMATVPGLVDVFPFLGRFDVWSKRKSLEVYRHVKLIWGDFIKERRKAGVNGGGDDELNSKRDFLDVLKEYSFGDDQIAFLLTELIIAGTDTTSVTSVWLMAELVKNQEIFHQVRREIESCAVEGGVVRESQLSECSYFEACIKETLRLHVPGPFGLPHRATRTCKVRNYTIPKGSLVVVNAWAIHLDHSIWEDASSFKPERFLDSRKIDLKGSDRFDYLPFSAGIRMCPGWGVAINSVQLMVASLVYYFDWSLLDGENPSNLDMSAKFSTTLKMDKPLYLIPKLRENIADFEY